MSSECLLELFDRRAHLVGVVKFPSAPTSHDTMEFFVSSYLRKHDRTWGRSRQCTGTIERSWIADRNGNYYYWVLHATREL